MKFKVFENIAFVLSYFGLYPQHLTGTYSFMKLLLGSHLLFVIFAGFFVSSPLFVFRNLHNFGLVLETSLFIIAGIQICGMVLSIRLNLEKVENVHLIFQEIVNKSIVANSEIIFRII